MAFLSKLSEIGLLFSSHQAEIEPTRRNERPKIFMTAGILESRKTTPFLLSAANHQLLKVLANHADLYLPVSETDNNRQEIRDGLRVEGVQPDFL